MGKNSVFFKYQFDFQHILARAPIWQSVRVCHSSKCAIPNSFAIGSASKQLETHKPNQHNIKHQKKLTFKGLPNQMVSPLQNLVQFTIPDS